MKFSQDLLGTLVIILVLVVSYYIYNDYSEAFQLKCIVSTVDGNKYCVRERKRQNEAADLLAEVTRNCKMLVTYMKNKHADDERVQTLVENFNPQNIVDIAVK